MINEKADVFGKWAWPNFRSDEDSLPPEAQQEPDTPEENAAFDALHDLVRKNVPLAQSDASNLKSALQSGQYDAVQPPDEMFVYRGMSVSDDWLRTALKLPAGATLDREGSADGSFTFTPRKGESTSWTLNQGRAEDFAFASITSKLQYAVMMTAPVDPENMLAGPNGFYAVETLDAFPEEEEVVCIGPVSVATIEWMKKGLCTMGDPNDIFGKWAWPHDRNDGDPSTENEGDTSEEAAAYSALRKLVDSNVAIDEEDSRVIMAALRSGKYADVLRPPPPGKIYRGMSVPRSWLMRALNVSYEEEDLVAPEGESSGVTFTFTPRHGESSSWSLSEDMAVEYSRRTHASGWSIVMVAPPDPGTMICGPGGFYRVKGLDEYVAEDEVIAFGPVKVTQLRWKKIT